MNKSFTLIAIVILLSGMAPTSIAGQMIWPGDIDNNGRVSGTDLFYLGAVFWNSGPERPNASTQWNAQAMGEPWDIDLPGISMNAAYADANGDGNISDEDLSTAIQNNYGQTHGQVEAETFPPPGQEGIHSPIEITSPVTEASPGHNFSLTSTLVPRLFLFRNSSVSGSRSTIIPIWWMAR
jgi:hypothetical protein